MLIPPVLAVVHLLPEATAHSAAHKTRLPACVQAALSRPLPVLEILPMWMPTLVSVPAIRPNFLAVGPPRILIPPAVNVFAIQKLALHPKSGMLPVVRANNHQTAPPVPLPKPKSPALLQAMIAGVNVPTAPTLLTLKTPILVHVLHHLAPQTTAPKYSLQQAHRAIANTNVPPALTPLTHKTTILVCVLPVARSPSKSSVESANAADCSNSTDTQDPNTCACTACAASPKRLSC